mmetsp:Transcript_8851/g.11027  ORF Transcript_8851/g.11027 Transcript_8851/m.11027 type:complete len:96 (-) Transcript_8851:45-332(-)
MENLGPKTNFDTLKTDIIQKINDDMGTNDDGSFINFIGKYNVLICVIFAFIFVLLFGIYVGKVCTKKQKTIVHTIHYPDSSESLSGNEQIIDQLI